MGLERITAARQALRPHVGVCSAGERGQNLLMLRKAPSPLLGEDQAPVREHVELALLAFGGLGIEPVIG
jgi:hypothetical protein